MPEKVTTGANCATVENLALGKGVFFKNYIWDVDTPQTALAAGKSIGATQGGGNFTATPTPRTVAIDGMSGVVDFDDWTVTMQANVIELKPETIKDALGSGTITKEDNYWKIKARNNILPPDYISNITFIGYRKGDDEPFAIQIFNAISTSGLNMALTPNAEIVTNITWTSSTDTCVDPSSGEYAPFAIYIPVKTNRPVVDPVLSTDTELTGAGLATATIEATGGTLSDATTTVNANGLWEIEITPQAVGAVISIIQTLEGTPSKPTLTTVK
jgi:hypothetical protein